MMYVEFMKNFLLADSSERLAVRLILACWTRKRLMLLSRHDVRRVHEKFSSRRFERADGCKSHFRLLSPKTFDSYFLDMMYVEFMKNFFTPIRASYWLLNSFWLPETKNVSFLLSRHDLRRVHEKFSSRDSSERMAVTLIFSSWAQKRLILLSRHDVRRVHEKFSSRRFERPIGY